MNKILLFLLFISLRYSAYSQVAISPEVGISYQPFTLYGGTVTNSSSGIDFLVGVNGEMYLSDNYLLNIRVSYTNREDFIWTDICLCPTLEYTSYEHSDLNIDIDLLYQLTRNIKLGIGPSVVRKLDTRLITKYSNLETIDEFNDFYLALNGMVSLNFDRVVLKLYYVRRFESDFTIYYPTLGNNRIDLSFSYVLFRNGKR